MLQRHRLSLYRESGLKYHPVSCSYPIIRLSLYRESGLKYTNLNSHLQTLLSLSLYRESGLKYTPSYAIYYGALPLPV